MEDGTKYEGAYAIGHTEENNKVTTKQTSQQKQHNLFSFSVVEARRTNINGLVDKVTWFDMPCKPSEDFQLHERIIHRQRKC